MKKENNTSNNHKSIKIFKIQKPAIEPDLSNYIIISQSDLRRLEYIYKTHTKEEIDEEINGIINDLINAGIFNENGELNDIYKNK